MYYFLTLTFHSPNPSPITQTSFRSQYTVTRRLSRAADFYLNSLMEWPKCVPHSNSTPGQARREKRNHEESKKPKFFQALFAPPTSRECGAHWKWCCWPHRPSFFIHAPPPSIFYIRLNWIAARTPLFFTLIQLFSPPCTALLHRTSNPLKRVPNRMCGPYNEPKITGCWYSAGMRMICEVSQLVAIHRHLQWPFWRWKLEHPCPVVKCYCGELTKGCCVETKGCCVVSGLG